jgi:hypothetical protein
MKQKVFLQISGKLDFRIRENDSLCEEKKQQGSKSKLRVAVI